MKLLMFFATATKDVSGDGIALGGVILDTAMRKKSSRIEGLPVALRCRYRWGWLSF